MNDLFCQCGATFKTMLAEARHRHNFPLLCRKPDRHKPRKGDRHKKRIQPDERRLAVLDCETDPFDTIGQQQVNPFTCEIYLGENEPPAVFCNENPIRLVEEIQDWLDDYSEPLLIYAHNGGKFDYKLFIHLVRGQVMAKPGRIMKFRYGIHEFRDSLCLIPTALGDIHKETFDYAKMSKFRRKDHMAEILRYQHSDCVYLYEILAKAHARWGRKLTIGSVAKEQISKLYPDVNGMTEVMDDVIRPYFRGGRVEPIRGVGIYHGNFACHDFNSSYPKSMASFMHACGRNYFDYNVRTSAVPGENTVFLTLQCRSKGAFLYKDGRTGILSVPRDAVLREYKVSIHEYLVALKYDLLRDVKILECIDCEKQTDFANYILPEYEARQLTKALLEKLPKNSPEWVAEKIEDTLIKLLLNNSYGKFAEDPRNQKEYMFVEGIEDEELGPKLKKKGWKLDSLFAPTLDLPLTKHLVIYSREPARLKFNNVATAASITGGSRAMLLEALQFAINPIYCDTDSIICEGFYEKVVIKGVAHNFPFSTNPTELGALKKEFSAAEVGIAGKKLYYAITSKGEVLKCKGANAEDLSIAQMRRIIAEGASVINTSKGPCIKMGGAQAYIVRSLRATGRSQEDVANDVAQWENVA